MKSKNFNKRLMLNKNTVANLNNMQMKNLKGGVQTDYTCPICDTEFSCEETFCKICESIPATYCVECSG